MVHGKYKHIGKRKYVSRNKMDELKCDFVVVIASLIYKKS